MGQAADRKVTEIDETRQRLELDIMELERRLPAPLRSVKSLAGLLVGGVFAALFAALFATRLFSRRSERKRTPAAEVVVRVVREDRPS